MEYLDYDRTVSQFLRITGTSGGEFEHSALIENGIGAVVSRLKKDPAELDGEQLRHCEYAAAAVAAYEYAAEQCMKERPVMSENGSVSIRTGSLDAVKAAREIKRQAIDLLCVLGLADRGDFIFTAV